VTFVGLTAGFGVVSAVLLVLVPPAPALVLAAVTGFAAAPVIPFTLSVIGDRAPRAISAAAVSAALAVAATGGFVFPGGMGALMHVIGSRRPVMFVPALALLATALLGAWLRTRSPRAPAV
jgi:hypothetical protein